MSFESLLVHGSLRVYCGKQDARTSWEPGRIQDGSRVPEAFPTAAGTAERGRQLIKKKRFLCNSMYYRFCIFIARPMGQAEPAPSPSSSFEDPGGRSNTKTLERTTFGGLLQSDVCRYSFSELAEAASNEPSTTCPGALVQQWSDQSDRSTVPSCEDIPVEATETPRILSSSIRQGDRS